MPRRTFRFVRVACIALVTASCVPTTTPASTTTTVTTTEATTTSSEAPIPTSSSVPTTSPLPSGAVRESAFVVSVTDGDTIDVLVDGALETVRLIGINASESGECYSQEATVALAALVDQQEIHMVRDHNDRDIYGRLLRYLFVSDLFVNEELVAMGAAIARRYPPDTARADTLEAAQAKAQAERLGMWAEDACGSVASSDLVIEELNYDAPGNDNENLNGEWIVIRNNSQLAVVLDGWVVKDESASHRYRFPAGFTLEPGAQVTIYTGCGTDTEEALFWCKSGSAVWNNSGDTGFLLDPSGNIVSTFAY